jgi:fructosamine-3-kinase
MISANSLADALEELGYPVTAERSGVSGGCIANGQRLRFGDGRSLFVKSGRSLPSKMFAAEAAGLEAMNTATRDFDGLTVPTPLAIGTDEGVPFLLLEWIASASRNASFADNVGSGVALMHRTTSESGYGFYQDNFIGATAQPNRWCESWIEFFAEQRLRFQLELALRDGRLDSSLAGKIEWIIGRLDAFLPEPEAPSLVHGDLWGGNLMTDSTGGPVLIDPAVYYGHREVDIAMTRLFGGFSSRFYARYQESWPLEPGFEERVELYNLYHMLNHLNLFGGGYINSVRAIVSRYAE